MGAMKISIICGLLIFPEQGWDKTI